MIAKYFLFTFIAVTTFASCSDNDQADETSQTYNKVIIDTATSKKNGPDSSLLKSLFQPSAVGRNLTGLPENTTQNNSAALPGNNGQLNPAHGQPGHRCEIAVGAPLNSQPAALNPTQIQPAVTTNQVVPVTNATPVVQQVATGINPAHGQPNHRCDIAVGAPLNSKPIANNATNAATVKPAAPTATAVTTAPIQKVAPGMNPAHGQPNHRCDIAVGEPLNSKPAAPAIKPIATASAKADSVNK